MRQPLADLVRQPRIWLVAAAGFGLWGGLLVVTGALVGMSPIEYVPTALLEGCVLGGLLVVACMPPESPATGFDDGTGDPPPTPRDFDPTVWLPLFDADRLPAEVGNSREPAAQGARD